MFSKLLNDNKDDLLAFCFFLRLTPLIPNVFINIAAPIVNLE